MELLSLHFGDLTALFVRYCRMPVKEAKEGAAAERADRQHDHHVDEEDEQHDEGGGGVAVLVVEDGQPVVVDRVGRRVRHLPCEEGLATCRESTGCHAM